MEYAAQKRRQAYMDCPSGRVMSFNHDGIEIARRRKTGGSAPAIKFAVKVACVLVAFKVLVYFGDGGMDYSKKMASLAEGTALERVAATLMQIDPMTGYAIDRIETVSRKF